MVSIDESIAEAGQEILEGPYEDCVYCEGSGTSQLSRQGPVNVCSSCDGSGKKIRRQYQWACDLLGCTEKGLRATLDLRAAADNTKRAIKRREDLSKLEQLNNEGKKKWGNSNQSLEEILKRVAGSGNNYYGAQYRKNGKV